MVQVDDADFTDYWGFLSAAAKAPAFCNGVPGGLYSRFPAEAMCAKEMAGLMAVMITQTNGWSDDLVDANGEAVPYYLQGIAELQDPACDESSELSDDYCVAQDTYNYDANFYETEMSLSAPADGLVARGAGYIYGADMYYWFSQIIYGDDSMYTDPAQVATDPEAWWMSGLMRWMIPMNGQPSPHNIIIGQWEPTEVEADYGITDGFGAVSALLYGAEQCGMAAHPIANYRTEIFNEILTVVSAADGSWTAWDTVYSWEANDCAGSARDEFPWWGDYGYIPQFAMYEVSTVDWEGADAGTETAMDGLGCFVVDQRTPYIVWDKDAFRNCALDGIAAGRR